MLGLSSLVIFSLPLASYHAPSIPLCTLRRLRIVLSFFSSKSDDTLLIKINDIGIHATKTNLQ